MAAPCGVLKLRCEFRCTASTVAVAGFTTVTRDSAMRPRTVDPPRMPGPSKRTWLIASVLLTKTRPSAGLTARLNSVVPTPLTCERTTGVAAAASMTNKSLSGRLNFTLADQSVRASSRQALPSNFTIRPVPGAVTPSALVVIPGLLAPTASRCNTVVRLPDMKGAAYTVRPSALTASARGLSANSVRMVSGRPFRESSSCPASKTQTSARPVPGVVSAAGAKPGRC